MTPNFITRYRPLTARPFLRNATYQEFIPCKQLRPYAACFWSSEGIEKSGADGLVRVIPDTCMDIIIEINYTKQIIKSCLCGIQDYSVMVEQGKTKEETTRFAVRFLFWAVRRFLNLDMSDLYNQTVDLDLLKPGCNDSFEELFYCRSLEERIVWMEWYLLGIFDPEGYNPNLYNSIEYLLRSKGGSHVKDISGYSNLSNGNWSGFSSRKSAFPSNGQPALSVTRTCGGRLYSRIHLIYRRLQSGTDMQTNPICWVSLSGSTACILPRQWTAIRGRSFVSSAAIQGSMRKARFLSTCSHPMELNTECQKRSAK